MRVSVLSLLAWYVTTYSSEAATATHSNQSIWTRGGKDDTAHRFSKCTVCDSPTTVPTRAARATKEVARENCMVSASEEKLGSSSAERRRSSWLDVLLSDALRGLFNLHPNPPVPNDPRQAWRPWCTTQTTPHSDRGRSNEHSCARWPTTQADVSLLHFACAVVA